MEITTRQFERVLTCTILLQEACEKNNVALRAVNLIREQLDEIESDCPELEEDWDLHDLDSSDEQERHDGRASQIAVREYGQEILSEGSGLKNLITLTMEQFGLTQTAFANMIGVNQGSLCHYLRDGSHREGVLKAVAEFFGFDGKAGD